MAEDSHLFELAAHATAFALTGGEGVVEVVRMKMTEYLSDLTTRMPDEIEKLMTEGFERFFYQTELPEDLPELESHPLV